MMPRIRPDLVEKSQSADEVESVAGIGGVTPAEMFIVGGREGEGDGEGEGEGEEVGVAGFTSVVKLMAYDGIGIGDGS